MDAPRKLYARPLEASLRTALLDTPVGDPRFLAVPLRKLWTM
jgi:hypothetical protein